MQHNRYQTEQTRNRWQERPYDPEYDWRNERGAVGSELDNMYSPREQEYRNFYDRGYYSQDRVSGRMAGNQYGPSRRNDYEAWGPGDNYGYRPSSEHPTYPPQDWPSRRPDSDYTTLGSSSGLGNRGESLFGTSNRGSYRGTDLNAGAMAHYTLPVSHAGKGPKGYRRTDERIREDVSEALSQHHEIDASEIEVKVNGGEVILTGTVSERRFKRLAEDIAERCPGVYDVRNEIRVQSPTQDMQQQQTKAKAASASAGRAS